MSLPKVSEFVDYRLPDGPHVGEHRLALVVAVKECSSRGQCERGDEVVDLYVFGRPEDGKPFKAGPAFVDGVKRAQHQGPPGTWTACPYGSM